jgi:hypothetical protein
MSGRRFPPSEATRSFPGTEPRVPLLERRSRWRLLVGLPLARPHHGVTLRVGTVRPVPEIGRHRPVVALHEMHS